MNSMTQSSNPNLNSLNQRIFDAGVDQIRNHPRDEGGEFHGYSTPCRCAKGRLVQEGLITLYEAKSRNNSVLRLYKGKITGSTLELTDHLECIYECFKSSKYYNDFNKEEGLQLLAQDYGLIYTSVGNPKKVLHLDIQELEDMIEG